MASHVHTLGNVKELWLLLLAGNLTAVAKSISGGSATHLHKKEVFNFQLLALTLVFLFSSFGIVLLCHLHPLLHVYIIDIVLVLFGHLPLVHLQIECLFDIIKPLLDCLFLLILVLLILLLLLDLILKDSAL